MSKFYIVDTSLAKGGKSPVVIFETTSGLIKYLSEVVQRRFGQTRQQFMQNVTDLGFGADDVSGGAAGTGFHCESMFAVFGFSLICL